MDYFAEQPKPGIYPGVPFDDYLTWKAASNTVLVKLREKSPAHAKYAMDHPKPSTPAQIIGHAAHCLALEPDAFNDRYAVAPKCDRRTKAGKAAWSEFLESSGGRCVLAGDDYQIAKEASDAISKQVLHKIVRNGEAEVCIVWDDPRTNVRCKGRIDYAHRGQAVLVDLKTTKDASEDDFRRSMYKFRYYQQAAFYSDGWKTLTGDEPAFTFLAPEKEPPYAVAAYEVGPDTIMAGRIEYRKALEIYAVCMESGIWPGYPDKVQILDLSDWALKQLGINDYQIQED